jgi:hypothetical protein
MQTGLHLHHYVNPENIPELDSIHSEARPTAVAYVSTILLLYLFGLCAILVHYMNSSYGSWTWTLDDLWQELKPVFGSGITKCGGRKQEDKGEEEHIILVLRSSSEQMNFDPEYKFRKELSP